MTKSFKRTLRKYLLAWNVAYPVSRVIAHLSRFGNETRPNKTGSSLFEKEDKLAIESTLLKLLKTRTLPADLVETELAYHKKFFGPQGGTFGALDVDTGISKYYENTTPTATFPNIDEETFEDLFDAGIASKLQNYVVYVGRALYNLYKATKKSNSGLTGWTNRQLKPIRAQAVREASTNPANYDAAVAGARFKNNKLRNIFMDSFANQLRAMSRMFHLFSTFKNSDWVAWRGDNYVESTITKFMDVHPKVTFMETDYKSMDQFITLEAANWTIRQYQGIYGIPAVNADDIIYHMEELFYMPVLGATRIFTGKHNLLSGEYITNPLESLMNRLVIHEFVTIHFNRKLKYGRDYIYIILGDDVIILFDTKALMNTNVEITKDALGKAFADFVKERYNLKAHPDKFGLSTDYGYFCKRRFARKGTKELDPKTNSWNTKSIRMIVLAVLSVLYPEKDERQMDKTTRLIRIYQVLDDCYTHPLFKEIVRLITCRLKTKGVKITVPTQEAVTIYNDTSRKWKLRLYGTEFSPEKSPTLQYLASAHLLDS